MRDYLTSPEALEDVKALLSKVTAEGQAVPLPALYGRPQSLMRWLAVQNGKFIKVTVSTRDQRASAYYAEDIGDRLLVTDLGEAIRAVRLCKGSLDPWARVLNDVMFDDKGVRYGLAGFNEDSKIAAEFQSDEKLITALNDDDSNGRGYPNPRLVDLPIAILTVMLAQIAIVQELTK